MVSDGRDCVISLTPLESNIVFEINRILFLLLVHVHPFVPQIPPSGKLWTSLPSIYSAIVNV